MSAYVHGASLIDQLLARPSAAPVSPLPSTPVPSDPTASDSGQAFHVRTRTEQDSEVPDLVLIDDQLWSVRKILAHEIAADVPPGEIGEHVWWVIAAAGRRGGEQVCELGQAYPSGRWRLRSVATDMPARFQYTG